MTAVYVFLSWLTVSSLLALVSARVVGVYGRVDYTGVVEARLECAS